MLDNEKREINLFKDVEENLKKLLARSQASHRQIDLAKLFTGAIWLKALRAAFWALCFAL